MKPLFFALVILTTSACPSLAQNKSQIQDRIQADVTQALPGFTLKHRVPSDRTACYIWVREKDFVSVWLEFHQTINLARSAFVSTPWVAELEGMGKVSVPDEHIVGLGFDNYWAESVANKKRGLHF